MITTAVPKLIGVVDDDESMRAAMGGLLRSAGYAAAVFESGESFLACGERESFECLILDLRMSGMDGLELQRRLMVSASTLPVIFISAHYDEPLRRRAMAAGAADFFRKPFDSGALLASIDAAIDRRRGSRDVLRSSHAVASIGIRAIVRAHRPRIETKF